MKSKIKIILGIIIILAIVVLAIGNIVKTKVSDIQNVNDGYADMFYTTYTVKREDVKSYIRGAGTITSFNIETLELGMGDKVNEILVSEGQKVNAKQDILKVIDENGKSKTIKSSISGMFFCIENQTEGTKYCIYNLDDIGVKIALSEKDITSVMLGQKATVNITALNKEFEGTVSYVSSLPQNDKFIVKVKLDYTDDIKFGYSTSTSILSSEKLNSIVIPYSFVNMTDDGRYYVFKEEHKMDLYDSLAEDFVNDEAWRTYIEVGTVTANNVEVLSGLNEGDKILGLSW